MEHRYDAPEDIKLDAVVRDPGISEDERDAFQKKADEFRKQLGEGPFDPAAWAKEVERGKQLVKALNKHQWELGELTHKVDKIYGEARLEKFAKEIGASYQTLKGCRATWRAWFIPKGEKVRARTFSNPSEIPISYRTACSLNRHPDRWEIARQHPGLSSETARKMMKKPREPLSDVEQILKSIAAVRTDSKRLSYLNLRRIAVAVAKLHEWLDEAVKKSSTK